MRDSKGGDRTKVTIGDYNLPKYHDVGRGLGPDARRKSTVDLDVQTGKTSGGRVARLPSDQGDAINGPETVETTMVNVNLLLGPTETPWVRPTLVLITDKGGVPTKSLDSVGRGQPDMGTLPRIPTIDDN